jgi:hypothetical protein
MELLFKLALLAVAISAVMGTAMGFVVKYIVETNQPAGAGFAHAVDEGQRK